MSTSKTTDAWSPWGEAFAFKGYIKLPERLYEILDELGFTLGQDRVIIEVFRLLRPGSDVVYFLQRDIADRAKVDERTVRRVIKSMEQHGMKVVSTGSAGRLTSRASVYDLTDFKKAIAWADDRIIARAKEIEFDE